uniref:OTU domain-containing protein n=1 Tax=Chromera velia CCMP2878 TaxID=1169474 RepID=A0A0G4HCN8_9ALVE|eukprot:Cvel_6350.t1-p1 / transcript=Cvel_6350.t1 / gene=Cvel_6350 / organism=Chromera_velia_CCMP2878 / gene_product=hypothetical protein / transcript_product=hypothetical protein / location=Cvel_scaffold309:2864-4744(-) / protein_length=413 / sequence_SO=supercontig / SO=protein_coding / is_pseudo=false
MELIQAWFTNLLEAEVSIRRVEGHGGDSLIGEDDDEEEEEADGDGTGSRAVVLVDDLPPETIFMARDEMPKDRDCLFHAGAKLSGGRFTAQSMRDEVKKRLELKGPRRGVDEGAGELFWKSQAEANGWPSPAEGKSPFEHYLAVLNDTRRKYYRGPVELSEIAEHYVSRVAYDVGIRSAMLDDLFEFFVSIGCSPTYFPFGLFFDLTKVTETLDFDQRGRRGLGLATTAHLTFTSEDEAVALIEEHGFASYVLVVVVVPLVAPFKAFYRVAAIFPVTLEYTSSDLYTWVFGVGVQLRERGFQHLPLCGFDGASQHRKLMLQEGLRDNPGGEAAREERATGGREENDGAENAQTGDGREENESDGAAASLNPTTHPFTNKYISCTLFSLHHSFSLDFFCFLSAECVHVFKNATL